MIWWVRSTASTSGVNSTGSPSSAAASVKNLEITIGKAITPEVIAGLTNFARGVNYLASVIDKHPLLGKAIGE
mgnify:CR=1 FL=1